MMNNYLWLVVMPNLDTFFICLGVLGILGCIVAALIYAVKKDDACNDEDHKLANKLGLRTIKVFALSLSMFFITCFIPSKKDIIQLKIISVVSELKGLDKIPQKLVDRLNDVLGDEKDL